MHVGDIGAGREHDAGGLVAHDVGERADGGVPLMELGMADAGGELLDEYPVWTGRVGLELRAMKMQPYLERALGHKGLLHA